MLREPISADQWRAHVVARLQIENEIPHLDIFVEKTLSRHSVANCLRAASFCNPPRSVQSICEQINPSPQKLHKVIDEMLIDFDCVFYQSESLESGSQFRNPYKVASEFFRFFVGEVSNFQQWRSSERGVINISNTKSYLANNL